MLADLVDKPHQFLGYWWTWAGPFEREIGFTWLPGRSHELGSTMFGLCLPNAPSKL
jgi:hypothetical protein